MSKEIHNLLFFGLVINFLILTLLSGQSSYLFPSLEKILHQSEIRIISLPLGIPRCHPGL